MLTTVVDTLRKLDDPALTTEFRRLELERRRIEAQMAAVVAEGQRRSIHVIDHHHSMTGWLKANANYSGTQCNRLRRLARLVDELPDTGDALHAGYVGTAQADELARVRANPRCGDLLVDSIDVLLDQAERLPFDDARTCLHGPDAPASQLPRTDAQRRYDARQAIFRKSVTAPADGRPPTPLVNIFVDQRTHEEGLAAHDLVPFPVDLPDLDRSTRRCETDVGIDLLPNDVVRASLQGHVRRVVMNSAGVVIEMGRRQRLFTGAAREAAKLMATRCEHPGCGVAVTFAQVDHMTEWSDHGDTEPENSSIACRRHNAAKHTQYRVKRTDRGDVIYHRRDGSPMLPAGRRHPDDLPPDDHQLTDLARKRARALRVG